MWPAKANPAFDLDGVVLTSWFVVADRIFKEDRSANTDNSTYWRSLKAISKGLQYVIYPYNLHCLPADFNISVYACGNAVKFCVMSLLAQD